MISNVTLLESSTQLSGRVRAERNRCKPISRISDRSGKNGRLRVRGRRPTAASSCICDARTSPHRGRRITSDFPCRSRHWMTRGARMPFQTRIDKFEAEKKRYGAGKCQQSVRRGCLFICPWCTIQGPSVVEARNTGRHTPSTANLQISLPRPIGHLDKFERPQPCGAWMRNSRVEVLGLDAVSAGKFFP